MKYLNRFVVALALITSLLASLVVASPSLVSATAAQDACAGVSSVSGSGCTDPTGSPSVEGLIATVVKILSFAVGLLSVIMIIIGGLRFVLSGGDSNNTNSARNTIIYAIVGLVIAGLAQLLVIFVLNKVG